MSTKANPVLVNTLRGDLVECQHRGAIAICDPKGRIVKSLGNIDALVYPRSSIKPLQALPLIETGAADHFQLSDAELALACASHRAEPAHTDTISRWLARIDLDDESLECGAHAPADIETAENLLLNHQQPRRLHNNCSGKHTGMLTVAKFLQEDTRGYIDREHPAQQRWLDAVGDMADLDMRQLPWSYDGCGIPVIAMPLVATATAFARFGTPDDLPAPRAEAAHRLARAIAAEPFMVAGSGRLPTEVMQLTGLRLMIKSGAEGFYAAALPEQGLGIALKIDDGQGEASEVALLATLNHLGVLQHDEVEALSARCRIPISNTLGVVTGYHQAASIW